MSYQETHTEKSATIERTIPHIIAVDFDGTLCENKYPEIGWPKYHIIQRIKRAQQNGSKIILWTCRHAEWLDAAVAFCSKHGIHLDAINDNLPEVTEKFNNNCRKIFADEYWDDKAVLVSDTREEL